VPNPDTSQQLNYSQYAGQPRDSQYINVRDASDQVDPPMFHECSLIRRLAEPHGKIQQKEKAGGKIQRLYYEGDFPGKGKDGLGRESHYYHNRQNQKSNLVK
jgi:hypothetical protein